MKILITGSSGMLGGALCKKLINEHELIGLDTREAPDDAYKPSVFFDVNLTDRDLFIQKIEEISPQAVVHCAAYTDVDGCETDQEKAHTVNTIATVSVAEGCKLTSSYMIYISTDFVFDGEKKSPYTEDDKPDPINFYGKTKLEGEKAVADILKDYLIIRSSWLFGGGGRNFVDAIIKKAGQEKELKVVNDQVGSPTYVNDLADAILVLLPKIYDINPGIINITNSNSCTWYEYAKAILLYAGIKDVNVVPVTQEQLGLPARRPGMSALDNSKYNQLTGRPLRGWQEALKEYMVQ